MRRILIALCCLFYTLSGCTQVQEPTPVTDDELFVNQAILGYSHDVRLDEISGMIPSQKNPGLFWVHNDGGDGAKIYLIDTTMQVHCVVEVEKSVYFEDFTDDLGNTQRIAKIEKVRNIDWEDMTLSRTEEQSFIVIGDIGDNRAQRDSVSLYRFEEPLFTGDTIVSVTAERMILQYQEGARDAETLMTDSKSGDMIIISKRDPQVKFYVFSFEPIQKIISSQGKLDLTYLTAGDINKQGDILIKSYGQVYMIRNPLGLNIVELLSTGDIKEVNYIEEIQGEAICWGTDLRSYYTTSEKRDDKPQPFYKYF